MNNLLLITFAISLFCVGLRIISSNSKMIFYFLRKPYDKADEKRVGFKESLNKIELAIASNMDKILKYEKSKMASAANSKEIALKNNRKLMDSLENGRKYSRRNMILFMVLKPVIGCCTCMASVWTLVLFVPFAAIAEYESFYYLEIIPAAFIVAAKNSLIMSLFELIESKKDKNCK